MSKVLKFPRILMNKSLFFPCKFYAIVKHFCYKNGFIQENVPKEVVEYFYNNIDEI